MQTPSVGRIVHYVRVQDEKHCAAVITDVLDADRGTSELSVFASVAPEDHSVIDGRVLYDARMSPGTWHYPEHVGTVQYHESEDDEASKREGPVSNSPEVE